MHVGFAGLGSMGLPMARNILKAGHDLRVWNRSADKAQSLANEGATVARSPADLASCGVVFAMLSNDEAYGATIVLSGLLAALPSTATFVNCGTISIACARDLSAQFARRGVGYVAAPVLGRPDAAAAGMLNVIAAGERAAIARVQPLLDAIGRKTWHVGDDPAQANVAKIGANFLIASAIESMGEAFALAESNGLDPRALHDIVSNTLFAAPVYQNYGAQILEKRFEPAGFALRLGLKDVGLALSAGLSGDVRLPIGEALGEVFAQSVDAGDGDKDWSAVSLQAKRAPRG